MVLVKYKTRFQFFFNVFASDIFVHYLDMIEIWGYCHHWLQQFNESLIQDFVDRSDASVLCQHVWQCFWNNPLLTTVQNVQNVQQKRGWYTTVNCNVKCDQSTVAPSALTESALFRRLQLAGPRIIKINTTIPGWIEDVLWDEVLYNAPAKSATQ